MGVEWYDMIARRNGGYKSNAAFWTEGISAEPIFEERLKNILPRYKSVLDAGCGHGEFTIRMSRYSPSIIGFDNSIELITIANSLLTQSKVNNVKFMYATTKSELPFKDNQFDLIYDRRGPTSIINHSRILCSGGTIFGIHTNADAARERLKNNDFMDIEIEEFNTAINYFMNEIEFAKFISGVPGNPDFTLPAMKDELSHKVKESQINGRLGLVEERYIWKATKP